MRLAIFGATGATGRHLVSQALGAGHDVTAVVRDPDRLPVRDERMRLVVGSMDDPATVTSAVDGAGAVLSGLGARPNGIGICSEGTGAILDAMQATGVRRIVVISAAPIGTVASPGRPHPPRHDPGDGFVYRHTGRRLLTFVLRKAYADLALMEDVLRDSGLDWTAARPPRLTDKPLTGVYRTELGQNPRRGYFLSRADLAHAMLGCLDRPETVKQTLGVAY